MPDKSTLDPVLKGRVFVVVELLIVGTIAGTVFALANVGKNVKVQLQRSEAAQSQ